MAKELLLSGGAYGHLSHPFDIDYFTFKDYKDIIINALSGKLEYTEEKTDGTNLLLTWRDNHIVAARSKSHLKDFGVNALTISGIEEKFRGRPLEFAYGQAMRDMQSALLKLTTKQRDKIFGQGHRWMSVEVMMPVSSENIIKYGVTELRLHGTLEHDEQGNVISQINKENARMLDGMLRQVIAARQEKYHIRKLSQVNLPSVNSFSQKKSKYISELNTIMKSMRVKDSDTILDAKKNHFLDLILNLDTNHEINDSTRNLLLQRWVNNDKSIRIHSVITPLGKDVSSKIKEIDSNIDKHYKDIIRPLEFLFLKMGADVLSLMTDFMALNPDEAIQKMKTDLEDVISLIKKSDRKDLMDKMKYELDRLDKIGGVKAIIPSEGITFFYKGELLKLTGTFAPINQLMGLRFRL